MSKFIPNYIFKDVSKISVKLLKQNNIKLLLLDIDNTLAAHNSFHIEESVIEWLTVIVNNNIDIVLFSNNNIKRVGEFSDKLNSMGFNFQYIHSAKKPLRAEYIKATNSCKLNKSQIMGIGDQIFTDVWGANEFGVISVLVEPIKKDYNLLIKLKRNFEGIFVKQYYKRLGKENED